MTTAPPHPAIGLLQEKSLHAALKEWYARPGDRREELVDGYVIDLVRGPLLIEIQTANFAALRRKLAALLPAHRVRLVFPIVAEKRIVREGADGAHVGRPRRSPRRGDAADLFHELVSLPRLPLSPRFSLETLLVRVEETRVNDGRGSWWRRGWSVREQRLERVEGRRLFRRPADYASFLPAELPRPFTTGDLARALEKPADLAQKMLYCLRHLEIVTAVGKRGNAILYERRA